MAGAFTGLTYPDCQPPGQGFTEVLFKHASLGWSNLGGIGGRCDAGVRPESCAAGATSNSTPPTLYMYNVGVDVVSGTRFDLLVTNESEYLSLIHI